jgi:hypothetical protein
MFLLLLLAADGTEKDNADIAGGLLDRMKSSGMVTVPMRALEGFNQSDLDAGVEKQKAWAIELMSDPSPRQPSFVERLRYLDSLLVRAVILPERAVLEGQFGTKAEAGVHADFALTCREIEHRYVTRLINWHVVDQLLALNWGDQMRSKVRLVASPLVDDKKAWLKTLFTAALANPTGFVEVFNEIDLDALLDQTGTPKRRAVAEQGDLAVKSTPFDRNGENRDLMDRIYRTGEDGGEPANDNGSRA